MRLPHGFIRVSPLVLDRSTQGLVFALGASIRDSGLIQSQTKEIPAEVKELLDARQTEMTFEDTYEDKPLEIPPGWWRRIREINRLPTPVLFDTKAIWEEENAGKDRRLRRWFRRST